jgi:prevent-host-death family protein
MTMVGVHEAKTNLSGLLRRVASGEEIIITNGGEPAARLIAITPVGQKRIGSFAGQFTVPVDFDETPSELTEYFT